MKKILFRCDSSSKIGLGHQKRSILLAQRLLEQDINLEIIFFCQNLDGNINDEVKQKGFELKLLHSNNVEDFIKFASFYKNSLIIFDSYMIDYDYEKRVKEELNTKILSFDDTFDNHYSDIILNHGIQVKKDSYNYLFSNDRKIFCGSEYTLLRDEFFLDYNVKKINKSVGIIFGGNDVYNLSLKVSNLLKQIDTEYDISIITTDVNPNITELKNDGNVKLYVNISNIAEILSKNEFVICASGGNLFEIMALKLSFINIEIISNQKNITQFLESKDINTTIKKEELSNQILKEKIDYIKNINIYEKLELNFSKTKLAKEILKEIK